MAFYEKKIYSGKYLEIERYQYSDSTIKKNMRVRTDLSDKDKKKIEECNKKQAIKKLTRLMNTNFTSEDLHLTLTFKKKLNYEMAMNELKKFIRRMKYYCSKNNIEFKYIVTAGEDKNTGIHFHICVSGFEKCRSIIQEIFHKSNVCGHTHMSSLRFDNNGLEALARYFISNKLSKETLDKIKNKTVKHWWSSRNIKKPIVKKRKINKKKLRKQREFKKYKVTKVENGTNEFTGVYEYIQLTLLE